jgi:exodeoxyribonuclease VII large subunit
MARQTLAQLAHHGAFARMRDLIGRRQQRLDELVFRLAAAERRHLQDYRRRLDTAAARVRARDMRLTLEAMRRDIEARTAALASAARTDLMKRRSRLQALHGTLEALSPLSILERGYALVFDAQGSLIKDAGQVTPGDDIRARVHRGTVEATVKKIKE